MKKALWIGLIIVFCFTAAPAIAQSEMIPIEIPAGVFQYEKQHISVIGARETFVDMHGYFSAEFYKFGSDGQSAGRSTFDQHHFVFWVSGKLAPNLTAFLEPEWEHSGTEFRLDRALIDWELSNLLDLHFGRFYMPVGIEIEDYQYPRRKFISRPLASTSLLFNEWAENGFYLSGYAPIRMGELVYFAAIANGPNGKDTANLQTTDNNDDKHLALRLALRPSENFELGGSFASEKYDTAEAYSMTHQTLHLRFNNDRLEIKGEYIRRNFESASGTLNSSGYYLQAAYKLLKHAGPFNYVEAAFRIEGLDPDAGVLNNLDKRIYTMALTFAPDERFKLMAEYQITDELAPPALNDNGISLAAVIEF